EHHAEEREHGRRADESEGDEDAVGQFEFEEREREREGDEDRDQRRGRGAEGADGVADEVEADDGERNQHQQSRSALRDQRREQLPPRGFLTVRPYENHAWDRGPWYAETLGVRSKVETFDFRPDPQSYSSR